MTTNRKQLVPAGSAGNLVVDLLTLGGDLARTWVVERRLRAGIEADLRVSLARIEANQQSVLRYLDGAFAERGAVFVGYFAALDTALAAGNTEAVVGVLDAIVKLAGRGPFADLLDLRDVSARLGDPNTSWQL